jgi:hypothetical protein
MAQARRQATLEWLAALLAVAALLAFMLAQVAGSAPSISVTDTQRWTVNWPDFDTHYGTSYDTAWRWGMPPQPFALTGGGLGMDVVSGGYPCPTNWPGETWECAVKVLRYRYGSVRGFSAVQFTAQTIASAGGWLNANFDGNTCTGIPATAKVQLWVNDDKEFGRWWSDDVLVLADGPAQTVTASLKQPARWVSVWGKHGDASSQATKGFYTAQGSLKELRIAFGGGCFAGHGVNARDGAVRVAVLDMRILP